MYGSVLGLLDNLNSIVAMGFDILHTFKHCFRLEFLKRSMGECNTKPVMRSVGTNFDNILKMYSMSLENG